MLQGPRRGLVRAVFTGLGVIVCCGLVGCMNTDKDYPPRIGSKTKQPVPGLHGTTRLPGAPASGGVGLGGQPNTFQPASGLGASSQPMGGQHYNPAGAGMGGVVPTAAPGNPTTGSNFGSASQPYTNPTGAIGADSYTTPTHTSTPPPPNLTATDPIPPSAPGTSGYPSPPTQGSYNR